jgi:hypothetical protein
VPLLDHLQPAVNLAPQLRRGEVVAGEDGAHRAAQFFQGPEGRVFWAAAGNRRRIGSDSAVPSRIALAYLTIWSYCWAISSHRIGRVSTSPNGSGR